jgi:hypothetical protein
MTLAHSYLFQPSTLPSKVTQTLMLFDCDQTATSLFKDVFDLIRMGGQQIVDHSLASVNVLVSQLFYLAAL